MRRLSRWACLALALAGLHAVPAWALTEQQLRAAIADDDLPDDALFKPWPGVPDRTLVAWSDYRSMTTDQVDGGATPTGPDVPDVVDITVLVVQTSTGHVLQRYHEDKAFDSLAVQFDRIELDTADYALAPGRRAFGVRVRGRHMGCGAEDTATLRLLEPDGASLRNLLVLQTEAHVANCDCGSSRDVTRTLAIAQSATQGHADLVVHERRDETPDGSIDPRHCHPKARRAERTLTLHFDGMRYPAID